MTADSYLTVLLILLGLGGGIAELRAGNRHAGIYALTAACAWFVVLSYEMAR